MDKDKKKYLDHFYPGWGPDDFIPCERCGARGVETHHIYEKGMGGTKHEYGVDEIMSVCRGCHDGFHSGPITEAEMVEHHKIFMNWKDIE